MTTTLPAPIGVPGREFVDRRVAGTVEALARRGASLGGLRDVFADQAVGCRHLLVTSSVSQGLSNRNSDIDLIGLTDEATPKLKMAVQKFVGTDHYEIIVFSIEEWEQARLALERAAAAPARASLEALKGWNASSPISLKYLERIVNGVDVGGTMPYLDALPPLSVLWVRRGLEAAHKCLLCTLLAERAGERRGRLGYAINAHLFLMDAVLSHHGRVFNNRKWYLLRWRDFLESGACEPGFAAVARDLDAGFDAASRACRWPDSGLDVGAGLLGLYSRLAPLLGDERGQGPLLRDVGTPPRAFLPGVEIQRGSPGIASLQAGTGAIVATLRDLPAVLELESRAAGSILRAIRAGVYRID